MAALVEALVGEEFQSRRIFHAHPLRDLALEVGGVLPQRLQHRLLVLAEQRLHEDGGVAQVRRHAHLGDADQMRLQDVVMNVAALEQLAQHMADLLADAEQTDRAAFGGFLPAHQPFPLAPGTSRDVNVPRATKSPAASNSSASVKAMVLPMLTSRPLPTNEPKRAALMKLTLKSTVTGKTAPSTWAKRAGPWVSSSTAAIMPPCTYP